MAMFDRMEGLGLKPNAITCNAVINACAKAAPARVDDAMAMFDRMEQRGVKPNVITYNSVIGACARASPAAAEQAIVAISQMGKTNVKPNSNTLVQTLKCCAYSRPRRPEWVRPLFERFIKTGQVHLDRQVEQALRRAVDSQTAEELLLWAKKNHPRCCTVPPRHPRGGRR
jgi:pentatricopeptide repeat protein